MSQLRIINPTTGDLIKEVPADTPQSIEAKVRAARAAQLRWAQLPITQRLEPIRRFGELVQARREELAKITTSEVGKPLTQSRNEVNGLAPRIAYFLEAVPEVLAVKTVFDDPSQPMRERISMEPLGVVAHISPWNYPYFVAANVFLPALLSGNAMIYKPSEYSTLTGLALAELLHAAGIPAELFPVVVGDGAVGAALVDSEVNGIFFTGSLATGRKVAQAAAKRLIRVQLELGGKDPIYVCEDADVDSSAAATADGAFYNTGQSCCSVERIYVHQAIYPAFVDAFTKVVQGFSMGDPMSDKTYIGPLARPQQREILERQVSDALKKGGKLVAGGKRAAGRGFFFEPTVFVDATHEMDLMREESFGPIIGIQKVANDEEALRLMNDSEYGLTAGVYTPSRERAEWLLARLNAGSVYWNCCDRVSPRLPWSGRGHSGLGATLSTLGIQAFVQPKAWHLRGK